MDIFVTEDQTFQTRQLLDTYQSLIWTERYADNCEFELVVKETVTFTDLRKPKFLFSSISDRVMQVETAEIMDQVIDGVNLMKVKGRGLENLLQYRSAKHARTEASKEPDILTGTIADIARQTVVKWCIDPATAGGPNVIPRLSAINEVTGGTSYTLAVERDKVFDMVKKLCDSSDLGFRIYMSNYNLIFSVYKGIDRSNPDSANFLTFSPDNDTLVDLSHVESVANFKNNIRVLGFKTGVDVYATGYSAATAGFDRRMLVIEASDVGAGTDEEATTIEQDQVVLTQLGYQALATQENKYHLLVDGTVPPNAYARNAYNLGDIVLLKDAYGKTSRARITERIWSSDATGTHNTPTFEAIY